MSTIYSDYVDRELLPRVVAFLCDITKRPDFILLNEESCHIGAMLEKYLISEGKPRPSELPFKISFSNKLHKLALFYDEISFAEFSLAYNFFWSVLFFGSFVKETVEYDDAASAAVAQAQQDSMRMLSARIKAFSSLGDCFLSQLQKFFVVWLTEDQRNVFSGFEQQLQKQLTIIRNHLVCIDEFSKTAEALYFCDSVSQAMQNIFLQAKAAFEAMEQSEKDKLSIVSLPVFWQEQQAPSVVHVEASLRMQATSFDDQDRNEDTNGLNKP